MKEACVMDTYPPDVVANALLYHARESGASRWRRRSMTHMKLQKLVYFIYAWGLVFGKNPVSERPQVWEYGPIFSSLFHILKTHGSRPIKHGVEQMDPDTGEFAPLMPPPSDREFWHLLDAVWERYGEFSAMELSAMARGDDSPWAVARAAKKGFLDNEKVAAHYRRMLENDDDKPKDNNVVYLERTT